MEGEEAVATVAPLSKSSTATSMNNDSQQQSEKEAAAAMDEIMDSGRSHSVVLPSSIISNKIYAGWPGSSSGPIGFRALAAWRRETHKLLLTRGFTNPVLLVGSECVCDSTRSDDGKGWSRGRAGTSAYYCPEMLLRETSGVGAPPVPPTSTLPVPAPPPTPPGVAFMQLPTPPPPQGERKTYGTDCDWWSFGCLTYALLTGRSPFASGAGSAQDNALTLEASPSFSRLPFSPASKDFISRLLTLDRKKRLGGNGEGWRAVMAHPWFRGIDWGLMEERVLTPPSSESLVLPFLVQLC